MLTRIRNASLVRHSNVLVSYSTLNLKILRVLQKEAYIHGYTTIGSSSEKKKSIKIILRYKGYWIKKPLFTKLQRISKPGQRIYSGYKKFSAKLLGVRYNQGTAVISTSIGIMSHQKASGLRQGGEILCYIE
jgi:small subunit ribosomal protein S8